MAQKACRQCRTIVEGSTCSNCGSKDTIEGFKGSIYVLNPETSEIAQKLSLIKKGRYAIRLR